MHAGMPADTPADLVLTGWTVHATPGRPARALAVRGERVVAVGSEADVRHLVGPATRVVDIDGRCVVRTTSPGSRRST
jgi:predicted amidohydrolase YtcJ